MYDIFYSFISNLDMLKFGAYLGVILAILLIIMFLKRKNWDERGWKIFGKASLVTFIWLMIICNVVAKMSMNADFYDGVSYTMFANVVQWIFNTSIIIEIIAVLIIRKLE